MFACGRESSAHLKLVCVLTAFGERFVMSFEEIISEIQEKPNIWTSAHPYKNRILRAKAWRELAMKLNIEGK